MINLDRHPHEGPEPTGDGGDLPGVVGHNLWTLIKGFPHPGPGFS